MILFRENAGRRCRALLLIAVLILAGGPVLAQPAGDAAGGQAPGDLVPLAEVRTTMSSGTTLTIRFYPELHVSVPEAQKLGSHAFCALAAVGGGQACRCNLAVEEPEMSWILRVEKDRAAEGYCRCQAFCAD